MTHSTIYLNINKISYMLKDELRNNRFTGGEVIRIRHYGHKIIILINNILFCEAEGNYTNVYCKGDPRLVVICRRLSFFKRKLRNFNNFLQCHRAYIINIDGTDCFCSENNTLMISGYKVPVSRRKWNEIVLVLLGKGLKNLERDS
jgi:DNA-binding LytR/AlgR family response regulator